MRILAFTDLHSSITSFKKIQAKIKKFKPDILVCTGDFTIFEQNIEPVLSKINDFGLPCVLLHGNHESDLVVAKLCNRFPNLTFVHKKLAPLGDYLIVGHGGGGFYGQGKHLEGDDDFDEFITKVKKKLIGKLILFTHAPPAHTKLDYLTWIGDHVGCTSYEKFIKDHSPVLALSGHIHETFGVKQKIGKTLLCNPGPEGMIFELK